MPLSRLVFQPVVSSVNPSFLLAGVNHYVSLLGLP